jgi:hypothetical protein
VFLKGKAVNRENPTEQQAILPTDFRISEWWRTVANQNEPGRMSGPVRREDMRKPKAKPVSELGTTGHGMTAFDAAGPELMLMEEALFFEEATEETIAVLDADGRFRTTNSDH